MGGDFIVYFRDVKIIFDRAMLDVERDIDNEEVWGIISEREQRRQMWEMQRFGQQQILRFIESQLQAPQTWDPLNMDFGFTPTPAAE